MSQKPEALRLANELDSWVGGLSGKAADLLRNQHAEIERLRAELASLSEEHRRYGKTLIENSREIERLRAELEALRGQEPVAWAEMLADAREVFDANGSETPQVVRDVIEYVASWREVYADKSRAAGAQPAPIQEVYDWPEGATHYQPQQKAFYKRVSACEWYVWSRITDEPLHWLYSPGTMDSAEWIVRAQPALSAPTLEALEQEIYASTKRFVPSDVLKWMLKRYYTTEDGAHGIKE